MLGDPGRMAELKRLVEAEKSRRSLIEFSKHAWKWIEPGEMMMNWHVDCLADHLVAVSNRQIKRLLINLPPRHMKSALAGVLWPAWTWAHAPPRDRDGRRMPLIQGSWLGPGVKFTFLAYAGDLSTRDSVKCRQLIDSPWYQRLFGDIVSFSPDQNTKTRYTNTMNGSRLALSFQGRITGEGADILCIDDPHNVKQAESPKQLESTLRVWDETLPTRLNDPEHGVFIVVMQRIKTNDLTGHILSKELGWTHVCLPAEFESQHPTPMKTTVRISSGPKKGHLWFDPRQEGEPLWKDRFTPTILSEWKRRLGSYASAGQLAQRPAPREGGLLKRHWFTIVPVAPAVVADRVRCWDLASTKLSATSQDPDWTVGLRMSLGMDGIFYIEDVLRFRDTPLGVDQAILTIAQHDRKTTRIRLPLDPGQAGKSQQAYQSKLLAGYSFTHKSASGSNKEAWITPVTSQAEAGNIVIVHNGRADAWDVHAFLDELTSFPNADHDDQVDALAHAFDELVNRTKKHTQKRTAQTFAGAW
jgi:predicted phage terminase large subunit-like protein